MIRVIKKTFICIKNIVTHMLLMFAFLALMIGIGRIVLSKKPVDMAQEISFLYSHAEYTVLPVLIILFILAIIFEFSPEKDTK